MQKYFILIIVVFFVFLNVGLSFGQQDLDIEQTPVTEQPDVQWLWGEVVSVDVENKTLLVKYLDYETETENEISIIVDDRTTYENVESLEEIRPKDTVGIDYIINAEGNNIAKNISLEKPESPSTSLEEIRPEEFAPEEFAPPEPPFEEEQQTEPSTEPSIEY